MAVVSFPARNRLAYPAGRIAGFDPQHLAVGSNTFSGIAAYGGTINSILSGILGANSGAATTSLKGLLGPISNYDASTDLVTFPFVAPTDKITFASIFKVTATTGVSQYCIQTAGAGSSGMGVAIAAGNFSGFLGSGSYNTGVAYSFEVPYFHAVSGNGNVVNWVVLRLDTGKMLSGSITQTDSLTAGDGSVYVGNRSANRQFGGGIATAMASNVLMSEQQLRQWANEPWGFWFPPKQKSRVATAAAATFIAGWAQQTNLPVLGTGTY